MHIFRYIPGDRDQRVTTFSLPGIFVEVNNSEINLVHALRENLDSSEGQADSTPVDRY